MKRIFSRGFFFYSLILLILQASPLYSFQIQNGTTYAWEKAAVPVKTNLKSIHKDGDGNLFILSGFILRLKGADWELLDPQPPHLSNDHLFAFRSSNLWSTTVKYSSESELYFFDGHKWMQKYNPLANQILALFFSDNNSGWIGGDREIAFYDGSRWEMISFPTITSSVKNIGGMSRNNFWIHTLQGEIYHYLNNNWSRELPDKFISFFIYVNHKKIFALSGEKLFQFNGISWIEHSSSKLLLNQRALFFIDNNNIWTVGDNGTIRFYNGKKWNDIPSPTENNLNDILMLSTNSGWIVGNNGTLLKYSPRPNEVKEQSSVFFNQLKVTSISKELNDEYGVVMRDFNGDGLVDIYAVCIYEPNRMYISKSGSVNQNKKSPDPLFHEEALDRNVSGVIETEIKASLLDLGAAAADVDNDSDPDLYICGLTGQNLLLLNDGEGFFKNVSKESGRGTGGNERSNAAVFGDVDNDGDLDLFVTYEYASNRLYLNDGKGYFKDVTEAVGLKSFGGSMGASFADIDNDNDLDLCVANWATTNLLYRNEFDKGIIRFTDVSEEAGISGLSYAKSNGAAFADIDNDGDADLYITNRKSSNCFYINDGKGIFSDMTGKFFGLDSMLSYGLSFEDFDNDGFIDLYVANVGENKAYKNHCGKYFIDQTKEWGMSLGGYSTGTAAGDIDEDGDIDLYTANYIDEESKLHLNNLNDKNFIIVNLEGTLSNRDAIGTKLWLYEAGHLNDINFLRGYREVNGGSGYCSQNSLQAHFGTNSAGRFDLKIYFPASGIKKELKNISAGMIYNIREEEGFAASLTIAKKSLINFCTHPYNLNGAIKFAVVLCWIFISYFQFKKKKTNWSYASFNLLYISLIIFYWIQIYLYSDEEFWFATILPISSIFFILFIIHLIYERVILKALARSEREKTRSRIARDLHDDLASTLSSSYIYNESLKVSLRNADHNQKELVEKVSSLISSASDSVTDIIWNLSTRHDTLGELLFRLKLLVTETCRLNRMKHEITSNVEGNSIILDDSVRRNIYLIFKEGLNNIVKHSSADTVKLNMCYSKKYLTVSLSDNGTGINNLKGKIITESYPDNLKLTNNDLHGNGIKNILSRAKEINAFLAVDSNISGTSISLKIKLT